MPRLTSARATIAVQVGLHLDRSHVLVARVAEKLTSGAVVVRSRPGRRPLVAASTRLYASGSGTSGAVAAVVGDGVVGIDVEQLRPIHEPRSVAAMLDSIAAAWPSADLHEEVVLRWTRYEAVAKALGVGMVLPPRAVRIDPDGHVEIRGSPVPLRVDSWLTGASRQGVTHAVSVATRPGVALRRLSPPVSPESRRPDVPLRVSHDLMHVR